MAKKYHSLLTRTDGKWSVQFGDYDKAVVVEERDGTYCDRSRVDAVFKKDTRIITTGDQQAAIDAAVAKLNAPAATDRDNIDGATPGASSVLADEAE